MAIAKFLLLVVGIAAQHYGATPPNVRPPAEQLRRQNSAERFVPWTLLAAQTSLCTWALLETSVLVASSEHCPSLLAQILHLLLPTSLTSLSTFTTPSPFFVAGILVAFFSAALRAHCFRVLGECFTFELAIRPTHVLVTHDVYGIVRHPSYIGVFGQVVGWLLCALDPRGVIVAVFAGVLRSMFGFAGWSGGEDAVVMAVLACAWATTLSMLSVGMSMRMNKEDAMLEENFGEAWRAWARRVPCRLVPGLY